MKIKLMAAALAVAALAGCGGGSENTAAAPAADGAGSAAANDDGAAEKERALKIAAQGYMDAFMGGQVAGVLGYLDPEECDDEDEGEYAMAAAMLRDVVGDAKMKINSVYVEGDRGGVEDYELKNASDQLRRLIKSSAGDGRQHSWTYRSGEWYITKPCVDEETASPSPSAMAS